ncbi:hypothetical protein T492DRAFT_88559 [Pavlovales sp. CCMP2436]|nr:hypothetical protein T492DRAFT_88559 [Pavlovales sp. CCMP2436]
MYTLPTSHSQCLTYTHTAPPSYSQYLTHTYSAQTCSRILNNFKYFHPAGTLPTMFFCNGHGYFVHRIEKSYSGALPYSAHATYTYDGSSAAAKEQRFRDVGHWATPDPVEMSAGKFLAVGAGNLASLNPHGELGLGVHLQILKHQLHNLRDGLALAQVAPPPAPFFIIVLVTPPTPIIPIFFLFSL